MTPLDLTHPENSYKTETPVFNVARLLMHPHIKVFQFPGTSSELAFSCFDTA